MGQIQETSAKYFFERHREWSLIKHRILEKYLRAYLNKRGSTNRELYYIDGFAGAGRYDDGNSTAPGSPLLIADLATEVQEREKPYRLRCINVEKDPQHCNNLRRELARYDASLVTTLCETFESALPRILKQVGQVPAVFFLDPIGVDGVGIEQLLPVINRRDTEILLNLSTKTLVRLAGFDQSPAPDADAKCRLLAQTLGEPTDSPDAEWRREWRRDREGWSDWAAQRYVKNLLSNAPHLHFGMNYPVRESFFGREKYYLVFASRAKDGFPIMNDLVHSEEHRLFESTEARLAPSSQLSLFESPLDPGRDDAQRIKLQRLPDDLFQFGRQQPPMSLEALITELTILRFGEFRKSDYRAAAKQLLSQGRVQVRSGTGDKRRLEFVTV